MIKDKIRKRVIISKNKILFLLLVVLISGCVEKSSERCFCDTFQLFDLEPNNIVLNCYRKGDVFKLEQLKTGEVLSRSNTNNAHRNCEKLVIVKDTILFDKSSFVRVTDKSDSIIFCLISQEHCDSINVQLFKKNAKVINRTYTGNQFALSKDMYESVKFLSVMLESFYRNNNTEELAKYVPAVKEAIDRGEDPKVTSSLTYAYNRLEAVVESNIESVYYEMKKCRELVK